MLKCYNGGTYLVLHMQGLHGVLCTSLLNFHMIYAVIFSIKLNLIAII